MSISPTAFSRLAILALACGWAAAATNPKIDSGTVAMRNICVVPIEVDWVKAGLHGQEGMEKEGDEWGGRMQKYVAAALEKAGAKTGTPDANRRDIVLKIQQKYNSAAVQLRRAPGGVRKARYSLGDEVALLPCSTDTDAILFLFARAVFPTTASKIRGMIFPTCRLEMAFVDAKSGEVLAYTRVTRNSNYFKDDLDRAYAEVLEREFRGLHVGRFAVARPH